MRHLIILAALFGILGTGAFAPTFAHADGATWQQARSTAKTKWPECFCTDRSGTRRELGDIICLTVGDRSYEAKCVMVQNSPFWRDLERGCMSSSLPNNMTPFGQDADRFAG
ncbi:MAG: hypothetical protein AAF035_12975 [Pseudomonadota bacterium]